MHWRAEAKAAGWGLLAAGVLAIAIVVGSRNLSRFDAALLAYTFASLFAAFGIAYRYSMWLQRPPTALFWRKGWQAFLKRGFRRRNAENWVKRVFGDLVMNRFIFQCGTKGQCPFSFSGKTSFRSCFCSPSASPACC